MTNSIGGSISFFRYKYSPGYMYDDLWYVGRDWLPKQYGNPSTRCARTNMEENQYALHLPRRGHVWKRWSMTNACEKSQNCTFGSAKKNVAKLMNVLMFTWSGTTNYNRRCRCTRGVSVFDAQCTVPTARVLCITWYTWKGVEVYSVPSLRALCVECITMLQA